MTVEMMLKESKEIGKVRCSVRQIRTKSQRGLDVNTIVEHIDKSSEFITEVINLLRKHPEWNDEEIAEYMYFNFIE